MSGHTPGPWEAQDGTKHHGEAWGSWYVFQDPKAHPEELHICRVESENDQHGANARLIAAAPELLEALTSLLEVADWLSEYIPRSGWRMAQFNARSAIAKATGAGS